MSQQVFKDGLGVTVRVEDSTGKILPTTKGNKAIVCPLKRGPAGEWIPCYSVEGYNKAFGKKGDRLYGLYANLETVGPDAINAFFAEAGDRGSLWVLRIPVPGAKTASGTLLGRDEVARLALSAANEGRWAGYAKTLTDTPVVFATANTFTLNTPDIAANELVDAIVSFGGVKTYKVTSNGASAATGETVYRISSDNNLGSDGVTGPVTLTGTATYVKNATISGTIAYAPTTNVTGTVTVNPTAPLTLVGTGTSFLSDFKMGELAHFGGESRMITSISSNTTMTIASGFSGTLTGATIAKTNLTVTGTSTKFNTETDPSKVLSVGSQLSVSIGGTTYTRTIASKASDTSLTLASGFPVAVPGGTAATTPSLYVEGTGSNYDPQLSVGDFVIDPSVAGSKPVKVTSIIDDTGFTVETPFAANFTGVSLTKVAAIATVTLAQPANTGLSVVTAPGTRYPRTHFKLQVLFDGKPVLSYPDVTLDPSSNLFVESLINNDGDNIITDGKGYASYSAYLSVESLLVGEYETSSTKDVRPWNGSGTVVGLSSNRLYTVAALDYAAVVGEMVYPSIYSDTFSPQTRLRVLSAIAPVSLEGTVTIASGNVTVTGSGTNFLTAFPDYDATANPAYLYDEASGTARKVQSVTDDDTLVLETAFAVSGSGRTVKKAGYLTVSQGQDFSSVTEVGDTFVASYPTVLTGGADGDINALTPYSYTQFFNIDSRKHLKSAASGLNQGFIAMAVPGVTDTGVLSELTSYCEQVAYFAQRDIPPTITSAVAAQGYVADVLGASNNAGQLFPSFVIKSDELTGGERLISATGHLFGKEATVATANDGYHVVAAGTQGGGNGFLKGIKRLPVQIDPYSEIEGLDAAGIRPLTLQGQNAVVWGVNISAVQDKYRLVTTTYILLDYINQFQEQPAIRDLLFQTNQPDIDSRLKEYFSKFAHEEYVKGVYSRDLGEGNAYSFSMIEKGLAGAGVQDQILSLSNIFDGKRGIQFRFFPAGVVTGIDIAIGVNGAADLSSLIGVG